MANLHIPLTIPPSLQTPTYTVQFSIHSPTLDEEIFMEKIYAASDLTTSAAGGTMAVLPPRERLPRFRRETECMLRAHFWKGGRLVESEEVGRI